jgi:hypothetical protein
MSYPYNYNPFGWGSSVDSDNEWKKAAKEDEMNSKFNVGDKVKIRSSELDNTGIVKSYYNGSYGITEYCVDFEGKIHYCYEAELTLVRKKLQTRKCECGAEKTYGPQCAKAHHAHWCPVKGDRHA